MPVVALARALFAIIPKRGAWARGSGCDRSRRLLQAEPLKCQRLVGSGRQTATACRLHPAHFGFLGKASGSRLPFLLHTDTNGSWRSTVATARVAPRGDCLVSGRPTGLALGAGMAKSCRASPTRFDLKEEFACALRSSPECRRPLPRTSAANQRNPAHGGCESARNARPRKTGGQPCCRARGTFSPRP